MRACPNCKKMIGDEAAACGHYYTQLGQAFFYKGKKKNDTDFSFTRGRRTQGGT